MRHTPPVLLCLALAACPANDTDKTDSDGATAGADADTDTDSDSDADTDTDADTGDTGPIGYGQPTLLEVVCDPTANALRFECTVDIDPAQPVQLTFVRADGVSATRTVIGDDPLAQHILPMYFMAPEQDYDVEVSAISWPADGFQTTVTTGTPQPIVQSSLSVTGTSSMGMVGTHLPCDSDAIGVGLRHRHRRPALVPADGQRRVQRQRHDLVHRGLHRARRERRRRDRGRPDGQRHRALREPRQRLRHHRVRPVRELPPRHHEAERRVLRVLPRDLRRRRLLRRRARQRHHLRRHGHRARTLGRCRPPDHPVELGWRLSAHQHGVGRRRGRHPPVVARTEHRRQDRRRLDQPGLRQRRSGTSAATTPARSATPSPSTGARCRVPTTSAASTACLCATTDACSCSTTTTAGPSWSPSTRSTAPPPSTPATTPRENSCGPQGTAQSTVAGNMLVGCTGDWVREYDEATGSMIWEAQAQCGGGLNPGGNRWYPLDGW